MIEKIKTMYKENPRELFLMISFFKSFFSHKECYEDAFKKAINNTRKLGLEIPTVDFKNKKYLQDQSFLNEFHILLNSFTFTTNEINAQCYGFNHRIKKILDNECNNTTFIYTIGYVEIDGDILFQQSLDKLRQMIKQGKPIYNNDGGLNIHVWLTLPSMEIIDLTLPTSLRSNTKKFSNIEKGSIIQIDPSENKYIKYTPLLIGEDFFYRIGEFN